MSLKGTIALLALLVLSSFLLNPLTGVNPNRTDIAGQYAPPSRAHPFGTDHAGRDVLARVVDAVKLDVGIAVGSALSAFIAGVLLGAVSGYAGGIWDRIIMRLFDVWQAVPGMLLGLLVLSVLGKGVVALVGVIAAINVPVYGRMTRAELLAERRSASVEAARLSGVAAWKVLIVYLLPKGLASSLAYLPVQAGFAVAIAAGFGFIGLGVSPPTAEWGAMIAGGAGDLIFMNTWWTVLFPGSFLGLTTILLYRLGDHLTRLQSDRTASGGSVRAHEEDRR